MNKKFIKIILGIKILVISATLPLNIYAQSSEQELESIVIVPGIVGSWNWDIMFNKIFSDSWDFIPKDDTWDKMMLNLENAGYEIDKNLIIAFYDWRKSNIDSANNYLIPAIDKALENSPTGKVNIVAHSMGGLVARAYIQGEGYRGDVNKLIMLGTPNLGSADIYVTWAGGEIPEGWTDRQKLLARRYIDVLGISNSGVSGDLETVRELIPSIQELLPIYDFLKDSEGNLKSYHDLTDTQNPFLEDLKSSADRLMELGGIVIIAGTSTPTIETIPVVTKNASDGDKWDDGKPQPIKPAPDSPDGDNRVMSWSAILNQWDIEPQLSLKPNIFQKLLSWFAPKAHAEINWESFLITKEINADHGSLPTLAIKDVFGALSLNPDSIPNYAPLAEADNIVSFWFASPVQVKVTDPQGRTITKNFNNIPDAVYDGETDPNGVKMVLIENALPGEYKLELTGSGNGEYHILSSITSDEFDEVIITQGSITIGEVHEYAAEINTTEPVVPKISEPVITLPSSPGNSCSIDNLIVHLKERITSSNLSEKVKNNLLKRMDKFEEKLDKKNKNGSKLCEIFKKHIDKKYSRGNLRAINEKYFSSLIDDLEGHSKTKEKN